MTRQIKREVNLTKMSLQELGDLMARIAESSDDDPEVAHSEADDVLIEVVMRLGAEGGRIAQHFEDVDRWYA